ncbi:MAG: IS1634 family transposase [Synechococcus sp.]
MSEPLAIDVEDVDHLGIIAGIVDESGLVEIVNEQLGTHEQESVSAGNIVKALILNCLGFLTAPLYLFSQFFEGKATEHLIGAGVKPEQLNDHRIGRVLDRLYSYGVTELFVRIALAAVHRFGVEVESAHMDGSSVSVHGQYLGSSTESSADESISDDKETESEQSSCAQAESVDSDEPVPLELVHGYSRDSRPDLKQFTLNLICSGDADVPLSLVVGNGNDADRAVFAPLIQQFQQQWTGEQPKVFVADAALFSTLSDIQVIQNPHYRKRGRPSQSDSPSHYTFHLQATLVLDDTVFEAHRTQAGRFVLATNLLDFQTWTNQRILQEYKDQQTCERGFRFLKDPLFFASRVFLKSNRRIMALAMIMGLCLLVYSLGQRQLRQTLAAAEATSPQQKGKPTSRPTLRWILQCFQSVHLVWLNGSHHLIRLNHRQQLIFQFLSPHCQKYYLLPSDT